MNLFSLLIVAAAALTFFVWLIKDEFRTEKTLPVFRMSGETGSYDELLLVRRVSPNGDILLKRLKEKTISRYDVRRRIVSETGEDVWQSATEKIAVCESAASDDQNDDGQYGTYGKYLLARSDSPDRSKTAVLSAAGPKIKNISLMPFLGGGHRIYGTRYLEIKRAADDYANVRQPLRVEKMFSPLLCWTADGNSVVVYDNLYNQFSVADFNSQPPAADAATFPNAAAQTASKPDLSRLTGVVRDYGVDENGDGLFEKIAVEIETETGLSARYKISVSLESNAGQHFAEQQSVELKGGAETTKLFFDTKPWFDEKIDGAFKISFVDLDYKDHPLLERREDLGYTREYKLSQFARPNVIFTGENVVAPIDRNGDGTYESLQITVGVDVFEPGDYEFQGDLYDETTPTNEGFIELFAGKAALAKGGGSITFVFRGEKIAKHAVSGKLRLRNVIVYKPGSSAPDTKTLMETSSFDAKQFRIED